MSDLIAIFTSRLAGPISSAFALLFLILALSQCVAKSGEAHRADRAEAAVVAVRSDLTRCQDSNRTLTGSLATQSAAVDGLKAEATIRTQAAEKAVTEALKGRAGAEARAAKLLKVPPAGIDACARAMSAFETVKGSLQ